MAASGSAPRVVVETDPAAFVDRQTGPGGERVGPLAGGPHDRVRPVRGDVPIAEPDDPVLATDELRPEVHFDAATAQLANLRSKQVAPPTVAGPQG